MNASNSSHNRYAVPFTNRLISTRKSVYDESEKLLEQFVKSTKFDLFYDVWLENIILEALGEFRTPIWFPPILTIFIAFNV